MPVVSRPQPRRPPRLVYVLSFSDWNIWRVETPAPGAPALSPPVVSISSTRMDSNAQFSPDGRRVVFASNRSGEIEIWLADPDGANAVQLTSMGAQITASPHWSPDGQMIVFDSNLEGQYEIYAIPASGGKARRLTSHPANDAVPSFSRDGQWIYSHRTEPESIRFGRSRRPAERRSRSPATSGSPPSSRRMAPTSTTRRLRARGVP